MRPRWKTRDVLWLVLVIALMLGWGLDHARLAHRLANVEAELRECWGRHDRLEAETEAEIGELEATLRVERGGGD